METAYGHYEITLENAYQTESSFREESIQKSLIDGHQQNGDQGKSTKRFKKNLENTEILSLHNKKENLQRFIEMIGEHSLHPIRNDILQHCEKVSINIPCNISRETVMKLVKNRVEKMIKNKRIKKNWSEEDLKILVWVISKYCQYHGISSVKEGMTAGDWNDIANLIPGVTGKSCMFKWLSLKKNNLADNSWIEEESLLLDQMVKKYGENNWCRVSEELFLKNTLPNKIYRCPKQCREHWNCYLNPQLKKGPWDKNEDYLLVRAVKELEGVKKWAEIVKMFNGRTQNALKNRFNLIIEKETKELKKYKKPTELQVIDNYLAKHQNQCEVDQENLKFLTEKRNHYTQIQSKKQPKKVKTRKIKEQRAFSEEDEYVPEEENQWFSPKDRRSRARTREVEDKQYEQKKQEFYCKNESIIASILSRKKDQPIFQCDEQESIKLQERERELMPNIWMGTEFKRPDLMAIIEPINVIPFSAEVLIRLKDGQVTGSFIPCVLNRSNQVLELSPIQR